MNCYQQFADIDFSIVNNCKPVNVNTDVDESEGKVSSRLRTIS